MSDSVVESNVYQLLKGSTGSQEKYRYVRHILKPTAETSPHTINHFHHFPMIRSQGSAVERYLDSKLGPTKHKQEKEGITGRRDLHVLEMGPGNGHALRYVHEHWGVKSAVVIEHSAAVLHWLHFNENSRFRFPYWSIQMHLDDSAQTFMEINLAFHALSETAKQKDLPGSFDLIICTHLAMGCYKAEKVTDRLTLEKALWAGALLRPSGIKYPSLLLGNCCLLDVNDGVSNIATAAVTVELVNDGIRAEFKGRPVSAATMAVRNSRWPACGMPWSTSFKLPEHSTAAEYMHGKLRQAVGAVNGNCARMTNNSNPPRLKITSWPDHWEFQLKDERKRKEFESAFSRQISRWKDNRLITSLSEIYTEAALTAVRTHVEIFDNDHARAEMAAEDDIYRIIPYPFKSDHGDGPLLEPMTRWFTLQLN